MSDGPERVRGDPREAGRDDQQSAAEERYRKIFEYNNDAVMMVDLETEELSTSIRRRVNCWDTPKANSYL